MIRSCQLQPTKPDVEGPFYREGAPFRTNLAPAGESGEKLVVSGTVRDASTCGPIAGAEVDVWQATPPAGPRGEGDYDNDSPEFKYRGRMKTDADGHYSFETLMPGPYPIRPGGPLRPKHIHFKITPPGGESLTTQMYFAGDPYNRQDPFFDPSLEVPVAQNGCSGTWEGTFDIALMRAPASQRFEVKAAA